jgi:hypothetical protein
VLRRQFRFATGQTPRRRRRAAEVGPFSSGGGHDQFEAYFGHFRVKEVFTIPCAGIGDVFSDPGLHADQRYFLSPSGVGGRIVFRRGVCGAVLP